VLESNFDHVWPPTEFVTPAKYQNCTKHSFQKPAGFFRNCVYDFSSASESAFPEILRCLFYMLNFSQKRCSSPHQIFPLVNRDKRRFPKKTPSLFVCLCLSFSGLVVRVLATSHQELQVETIKVPTIHH